MDPDYIHEIATRLRAESDHEAAKARRAKSKARRAHSGRPGREVVDADLSEIV